MAEAGTSSGNDLHQNNEKEWELIGTLENIITYPIETGFGFRSNATKVTPVGIETTCTARMSYIPFRIFEFEMDDR